MQKINRPSYVVGIDPSFREYGNAVAIIDSAAKSVSCKKFRYPEDLLGWLYSMPFGIEEVLWIVENSAINDTSFAYATKGKSQREALSMARSLGKNQAISIMVMRFLEGNYRGRAAGISPEKKGRKLNLSTIKGLLKQDGLLLEKDQISQDEIDATHLALIGYNQPAIFIQ